MKPYYQDDAVTLFAGDAREVLPTLPAASVHCVVTSPPYWNLRDYGVSGQLGLEPTPEQYVAALVGVFREVRRVLRDDGTVWLNLGDSYAAGGISGNTKPRSEHGNGAGLFHQGGAAQEAWFDKGCRDRRGAPAGLKPKDLVGIPWRVAFALQADGWWLRSDIIWHKPNPMPESVTDRPTKAHEYIFLLAKGASYYYDAAAIKERAEYREPNSPESIKSPYGQGFTRRALKAETSPRNDGNQWNECNGRGFNPADPGRRNRRSVWTVATHPYPEAHFATFPPDLIKPCVLAGTSERGACRFCGAPWERVGSRRGAGPKFRPLAIAESGALPDGPGTHRNLGGRYQAWLDENPTTTLGWRPTCRCRDQRGRTAQAVVLDPFAGALTTLHVAKELGRRAVGVELNEAYCAMGLDRLRQGVLL